MAQHHPEEREARTPDTGQGQNTAGGGQRGQGGKHRCRPTGEELGGEQQAEENRRATPTLGQQRRGGKHCCRQPARRAGSKSTVSKNTFLRIVVT